MHVKELNKWTIAMAEPMNYEFDFSQNGELASDELVYVAREDDNVLTKFFETKPEVLEEWGEKTGFKIVYLSNLIKSLTNKEVLLYRIPYLNVRDLTDIRIGNDFMLRYLENPSDRKRITQGLLRTIKTYQRSDGKEKVTNRFYPLYPNSDESLIDQLHRIGVQIAGEKKLHEKSKSDEIDEYDNWGPHYESAEEDFRSQQDEETIDDLMEEVRERICKLRQRGIAEHILEELIHPDNRLSRMVITKDRRIILPDYHDMEIKMEPLVKAVFMLFLKHPEGIVFKELPAYRNELAKIYSEVKPSGLSEKALQSIEDVTNPLNNSINEKCARIRGAFVGQFDNHLAKHYYIDGMRGEPKKITLPRDLVIWETE